MVEFITLFIGLVFGPIQVEVAVEGPVAAVVFELDGERVGELSEAPWQLTIDLGDGLRPRRLRALALDAGGQEIDRATRHLNVYRPPAEVDYALHRNRGGWVTMISLSWESRAGAAPRRSAVAIDGRPVEVDDPTKIWLVPLDPGELHVIETVVEYADGAIARDQIGVGGAVLGDSSARLTAVPVMAADWDRVAPEAAVARLAGSGERVRVVGVDRGDSELVFVRDAAAASAVREIGPGRATMGALAGARDAQAARVIHSVPLEDGEWVRMLEPRGSAGQPNSLDQHRVQVPIVSDQEGDFGLFWHLKNVEPREAERSGTRIADGVAIAGSRAAFGSRRRAAVLVLAAESKDAGSLLEPNRARAYLEALGVPLHVWYLGKAAKAPETWGPVSEVRSVPGMQKALDSVRESLEGQRIVWVEGIHLPGEVEVELGGG